MALSDTQIDKIVLAARLQVSFERTLEKWKAKYPGGWLTGQRLFELHDTYGLPFDVMRDECKKKGVFFDETGLKLELKAAYGWSDERIVAELKA